MEIRQDQRRDGHEERLSHLKPTEHCLKEKNDLAIPLDRMTVAWYHTHRQLPLPLSFSRLPLTKVLQACIKLIQELPHWAQQLPRLEMEENDVEDGGDVEDRLGEGRESDEVEVLGEGVDGLFASFESALLARRIEKDDSPPATLPQSPSAPTNSSPNPPRSLSLPPDPAPPADQYSTPRASSAVPNPADAHRGRRARRRRRWKLVRAGRGRLGGC